MAAPINSSSLALTGNTGTASYTPSLSVLASGAAINDKVQVVLAADGIPVFALDAASITAGWVLVQQAADATNACKGCLLRFIVKAAGTIPDPTITWSGNEAVTGYANLIKPVTAGKILSQFGPATPSQGSSTNPDPPAITNDSGATADVLYHTYWIGDGVVASTAAPTNYTNHASQTISNAANGCAVGMGLRTVNAVAASGVENPGVFTRATEQWVAFTTSCIEVDPPPLAAPADATHGHTADALTTSAAATCAPVDATHAQATDAITMGVKATCVPAENVHAQQADEPTVVFISAIPPPPPVGFNYHWGPIGAAPVGAYLTLRVPQNLTLNLADTVVTSDLVSGAGQNTIVVNDGATAVDGFSRTAVYARTLADAQGVTDNLTKVVNRQRSFADSVGATDNRVLAFTYNRALTDIIGAGDALTLIKHKQLTFADAVQVVDVVGMSWLLELADTVTAIDVIGQQQTRALQDTAAPIDAIHLEHVDTSLRLEAEPSLSYTCDVQQSPSFRLDAAMSSQLLLEVEE